MLMYGIAVNSTESVQIYNPCSLTVESRLYLDGQMEPTKICKKVIIRKVVLSLSMGNLLSWSGGWG